MNFSSILLKSKQKNNQNFLTLSAIHWTDWLLSPVVRVYHDAQETIQEQSALISLNYSPFLNTWYANEIEPFSANGEFAEFSPGDGQIVKLIPITSKMMLNRMLSYIHPSLIHGFVLRAGIPIVMREDESKILLADYSDLFHTDFIFDNSHRFIVGGVEAIHIDTKKDKKVDYVVFIQGFKTSDGKYVVDYDVIPDDYRQYISPDKCYNVKLSITDWDNTRYNALPNIGLLQNSHLLFPPASLIKDFAVYLHQVYNKPVYLLFSYFPISADTIKKISGIREFFFDDFIQFVSLYSDFGAFDGIIFQDDFSIADFNGDRGIPLLSNMMWNLYFAINHQNKIYAPSYTSLKTLSKDQDTGAIIVGEESANSLYKDTKRACILTPPLINCEQSAYLRECYQLYSCEHADIYTRLKHDDDLKECGDFKRELLQLQNQVSEPYKTFQNMIEPHEFLILKRPIHKGKIDKFQFFDVSNGDGVSVLDFNVEKCNLSYYYLHPPRRYSLLVKTGCSKQISPYIREKYMYVKVNEQSSEGFLYLFSNYPIPGYIAGYMWPFDIYYVYNTIFVDWSKISQILRNVSREYTNIPHSLLVVGTYAQGQIQTISEYNFEQIITQLTTLEKAGIYRSLEVSSIALSGYSATRQDPPVRCGLQYTNLGFSIVLPNGRAIIFSFGFDINDMRFPAWFSCFLYSSYEGSVWEPPLAYCSIYFRREIVNRGPLFDAINKIEAQIAIHNLGIEDEYFKKFIKTHVLRFLRNVDINITTSLKHWRGSSQETFRSISDEEAITVEQRLFIETSSKFYPLTSCSTIAYETIAYEDAYVRDLGNNYSICPCETSPQCLATITDELNISVGLDIFTPTRIRFWNKCVADIAGPLLFPDLPPSEWSPPF